MQSKAENVETYLSELPEDRKLPMQKLRKAILDNLPEGFSETMSYGMIGYVVPHSIYPSGYHCTPKLPLPFINIASQKNYISMYHMGIYANPKIYDWFCEEFVKVSKTKLDIGKGCIRFKKMDQIPYELLGELVSKISVEQYIAYYEENFKKR
jgi:uncharacterized protein YdhG (YjbR/CyaY superfamily)